MNPTHKKIAEAIRNRQGFITRSEWEIDSHEDYLKMTAILPLLAKEIADIYEEEDKCKNCGSDLRTSRECWAGCSSTQKPFNKTQFLKIARGEE